MKIFNLIKTVLLAIVTIMSHRSHTEGVLLKTDANELILKTNMGAGHGGKSGRFESLTETAEEFAFILCQLGVEEG